MMTDDPVIASRYEVGDFLGVGGFARVFRAKQRTTGQDVALKLLRVDRQPGAAALEVQFERVRREAQLCAALHHPNIVPLIDFGQSSRGEPFVVFALVPGQDLSHVLATEGALEPAVALHWMTQVLDALSCAHAIGVIHRDLKPENIMISSAGARRNALVLDFGISTVSAEAALPSLRRVTERGEYLGTPQYSAPEQLRGETLTVRADLYAWGLVFIECLTGEPAIGAASPHEAAHRQLAPEPVRIPSALEGHVLYDLLRDATQKDANKRELTAARLLAALEQIDGASLPSRGELLASSRMAVDRTSLVPMPSLPPEGESTWLLPSGRNPNFTGRDELLEQIAGAFRAQRGLPVVALHGLGGVGKSQLALEHAYRRAADYRLIAWMRAEEPETLAGDYAALAATLGLPETPNQRRKVEAVRSWLEHRDRWLLVFDNAPSPAAIRAYLPRSHAGHVLVTSRHPSWRDLAACIPVDVLQTEDAVAFLLRRSGDGDRVAAEQLSEELGRLPLALEEAAAYVEVTGRSLASYLQLLRAQRRRVLFSDVPAAGLRTTLRTTWELSFQAIERELPRASDLLKLSAYLAPDDIPFTLFRRGAKALSPALREDLEDPLRFDACVAMLRRYSLVKAEGESLSVHRLVQLATRERLDDDERSRWQAFALQVVEAAYPWNAVAGEYHPESGRFLSHAGAVLGHVGTSPATAETAARLLRRTGAYLSARGQHEQACERLQQAQALFQGVDGGDRVQLGTTLWEHGLVLYALGEAERAHAQLLEGLRLLERDAQGTQLLRHQMLLSLSWVHYTLGEFAAARDSARQSLDWLSSRFPETHPLMATALVLVGRAHWALGDLPTARDLVDRATGALERSTEPMHPLNCGSHYMVGAMRQDFGELDAAAHAAQQGRAIGERAYGRDHPLVCLNMLIQGSVLLDQGRAREARACFERVLESAQRACRRLHQEVAPARSELARALLALGDPRAAREHLEHALSELSRICGHKGRVAGQAHAALARLLEAEGELEAARGHARAALVALEADYGPSHVLCSNARRELAQLLPA